MSFGRFLMIIGFGGFTFGLVAAGGAGLGRLLERRLTAADPMIGRLFILGVLLLAVMAALIVMFNLAL